MPVVPDWRDPQSGLASPIQREPRNPNWLQERACKKLNGVSSAAAILDKITEPALLPYTICCLDIHDNQLWGGSFCYVHHLHAFFYHAKIKHTVHFISIIWASKSLISTPVGLGVPEKHATTAARLCRLVSFNTKLVHMRSSCFTQIILLQSHSLMFSITASSFFLLKFHEPVECVFLCASPTFQAHAFFKLYVWVCRWIPRISQLLESGEYYRNFHRPISNSGSPWQLFVVCTCCCSISI